MRTVKQLRQRIEFLLVGRIGEYSTPSGPISAVWVGETVPKEYVISDGIEVNIARTPELVRTELLYSGETLAEVQYTVRVIQHTLGASITEELLLLVANLRQYRDPTVIHGDDNVFEQATIYPSEIVAFKPQLEG